MEIAGK